MSTRKLILAALVCGLAILLAGGVFLVTLAGNRDELTVPTILAPGERAALGAIEARFVGTEPGQSARVVRIELAADDEPIPDAGAGWSLVEGSLRPPVAVPDGAGALACDGVTVPATGVVECLLAFEVGDGGAGFLEYARGDARVRWRLDG